MISILIADNKLTGEGLRALIENNQNDCQVKGVASDMMETIQKLDALKPDILLTEDRMAGISGIEIVRQANAVSPQTKVMICSTRADDHYVLAALSAGAKGYVLMTASFNELNHAIHKVYSGTYYLSDEVLSKIVDYCCQGNNGNGRSETLTSREREILQLMKDGSTKTEISRMLSISQRTVEAHCFHIMKKLHLRNQTELVRYLVNEAGATFLPKKEPFGIAVDLVS